MYTTTQLLLLLFAMQGVGGPTPPHVRSQREVAPIPAVNLPATANRASIITADVRFATDAAKQYQTLPTSAHTPWDLDNPRLPQLPTE